MGAQLTASQSTAPTDWNAVHRMIAAARRKLAGDGMRLQRLMIESRKRFDPLEEPFDVDLGLHRWLQWDREEAYSDWLEWVVGQVKDPTQLFRLFHLGDPPVRVLENPVFEVQRECCIPHGHADQEGRLDLVIRFGDVAIIIVELKKGSAADADTGKHSGYSRWLDQQNYRHKYSLFLAESAQEEIEDDFTFLSWQMLCVEMRRLAIDSCKSGRVTAAAMVLAFVAAVEQNLLGYSARQVQDVCAGRPVLFNPDVVDHIERFIEKLEL
jgi:hypothetical protein